MKFSLEESEDDELVLSALVKDTGIGVPEHKIHSLFSPFTQVDASTTRKYGGTGLGLAITHNLCLLMGGNISVESQLGQGSSFEFQVVLYPIPSSLPESLTFLEQNLRVLIVDDNKTNAVVIARQLKKWGATGTIANSIEEALTIYQAEVQCPFDIILLDSSLLDVNSWQLRNKIKVFTNGSHIPLVLMISVSQLNQKDNFADFGITHYLTKPLNPHFFLYFLQNIHSQPHYVTNKPNSEPLSSSPTLSLVEQKAKVLLVEDNKVNVLVAQKILEKLGVEIDIAYNGREAIDKLQTNISSQSEPYRLIFMDCLMPEMDGYETTYEIRAGTAGIDYQDITIIAMTANSMKGDEEKCLETGMNDYISKPINKEAVGNILHKWL